MYPTQPSPSQYTGYNPPAAKGSSRMRILIGALIGLAVVGVLVIGVAIFVPQKSKSANSFLTSMIAGDPATYDSLGAGMQLEFPQDDWKTRIAALQESLSGYTLKQGACTKDSTSTYPYQSCTFSLTSADSDKQAVIVEDITDPKSPLVISVSVSDI
jgi:hypothetical protein